MSALWLTRVADGRGLAPRISAPARHSVPSAGRPSVLLFRRYVTASALARLLWRLRRYQSSPLFALGRRRRRLRDRHRGDGEFQYVIRSDEEDRKFLLRMAKRWAELAAEKEREVRDAARSAA